MSNEKKPHFLVGFDPSLSSESLEIPCKFAKLISAELPGCASLLGPSGHTWHADIVQKNGDLCLRNGWAKFVRDNSLELGDSLVFRYDGELHFSILVFDQSKCEKASALSSEHSHDSSKKKEREWENPAPLNCLLDVFPKRIKSVFIPVECIRMSTTSQPDRTSSLINSECLSMTECGQLNRDCVDKMGNLGKVNCMDRQSGETSLLAAEQKDVDCILRNSVTVAVPSSEYVGRADSEPAKSNRTEKEELLSSHEAEIVARSFTSSLPNFTKVMKRFNVSGSYTLNIPHQFAATHLPKCKVKIKLHNVRGESWTINSVPTRKVQTSHTFCGGWLSFVRDNNIRIGDVCIFELVGQCELRVQVKRVMKEAMVDPNESEMHKVMPRSSCKEQNKISRSKMKNRSTNHCNKSFKWSESREIVVWEGTSPTKPASHTKGCVSIKSGPEEKLVAKTFLSSFPRFVRIMKKFNVSGSYTLKIPYQFSMEHLPDCRTEVTLHNLNGKCWTVNSITSKKVHQTVLHTFCGVGWLLFVKTTLRWEIFASLSWSENMKCACMFVDLVKKEG